MRVLSLFDGMACGMLAMIKAGLKVDRYVAFEIDKYAVQTSSHNFPMIEHRGDVFEADFTEFRGFDFLVGGSPCTYWSIAQKNNRETEASGMGWELFSQYVRALHEAQPEYFIYENNKSMSNAIRESITQTFGFEPICINSALVSAQNRQRLYWVGKRNPDGTYSKVHVDQPADMGILLRDILDVGITWREKSYTIDSNYYKGGGVSIDFKFQACRRIMAAEPVASTVLNVNPSGKGINGAVGRIDAKSRCLTTNKGEGQKIIVPIAEPVGSTKDGKSYCLTAGYANGSGENIGNYAAHTLEKGCKSMVAEPCRVGALPRPNGELSTSQAFRVYSADGKSVNITAGGGGAGGKTGLYAIPVEPMCVNEATKKGYAEILPGQCVDLEQIKSTTRRGRSMPDKCNCLTTTCQFYQYCGVLSYATPCEFDENGRVVKAISAADGKVYTVYEVSDGEITIKDKRYPIKLVDGLYIIRKLTVTECKRLQTVPEWYEFPVSDSQAYKMLGNGWTVDVIAHLITATQSNVQVDEQLDLFQMAERGCIDGGK